VRRALLQVEVQVFRTAERRVRPGGKGGGAKSDGRSRVQGCVSVNESLY